MTDHPTHTLEDLVRETGFSKRQIRFYITKQLAPGSGGKGPNAVYGDKTLRHLQMIAVLKEKRIAPTGRAMTLEEIRHALDTLPDHAYDALISGWGSLDVIDTDVEPMSGTIPPIMFARQESRRPLPFGFEALEGGEPETDLTSLLEQLRDLVAGLASDSRSPSKAPGTRTWSRLDSPDLEIHVRQPDTRADRARLDRLVRQLDRLLEREE